MGSKTLTEEEKRIAAIFIHVCGKKGISTVLINKQYRYSIGKVIGKWAIISYYQDQPYNYEKLATKISKIIFVAFCAELFSTQVFSIIFVYTSIIER